MNAQIFRSAVYRYTRYCSSLWDEVSRPLAYASNPGTATREMLAAGNEYTNELLKQAEDQLETIGHSFLVASGELKPPVFTTLDSNYPTLTMRFIVDPKKRCSARSFLFDRRLQKLRQHNDICFGSSTEEVTVHGELRSLEDLPGPKAA